MKTSIEEKFDKFFAWFFTIGSMILLILFVLLIMRCHLFVAILVFIGCYLNGKLAIEIWESVKNRIPPKG